MMFSELYGAYYNAVASILASAQRKPVTPDDIRRIAANEAFGESAYNIESALREGRWQLLNRDGTTPIKNSPTMPLTLLQRRWLKAISLDPRVRLFCDELPDVGDVEPLFRPEDVCVFDKYSDGDPYEDPAYVEHFRTVLDAVRNSYPLLLGAVNRSGKTVKMCIMPKYVEYSEKDDKFRVISADRSGKTTVNIARIAWCTRFYGKVAERRRSARSPECAVTFELLDRRRALERAMLHFAHFKKEAEKIGTDRYRVTVNYDVDDETELLIRILSFGPFVRVTAPDSFVELVKDRLRKQMSRKL